MVNRLVSVDEDLRLPPEVQEALVGGVEEHFEDLTTESQAAANSALLSANNATANAAAAAASAASAQSAADEATSIVTSDLDSANTTLLNNQFSTTRVKVDSLINALAVQTASIEDLFSATPISFTTIAGQGSFPAFVAPFPLRLTSVALVAWGAGVAKSDTAYWNVQVRALNVAATEHTVITEKTTKTTPTGVLQPGEDITSRKPWKFDTATFMSRDCAAGETINVSFFITGAAPAIGGPVSITIGYRPL